MNQHKFFTFMIVLSLLLLTLGQASVPRHVSAQTEEPPLVDQTIGLEPQTDGVAAGAFPSLLRPLGRLLPADNFELSLFFFFLIV